jgi:hypothetical protein
MAKFYMFLVLALALCVASASEIGSASFAEMGMQGGECVGWVCVAPFHAYFTGEGINDSVCVCMCMLVLRLHP